MKKNSLKIALCTFAVGFGVAASSQAALVTWDLNPNNENQSLGTSSQTFTVNGFSITAYGFDDNNGTGSAHTLYYKNLNGDHGLGVTGTDDNELQVNQNGSPAQFIQFDLKSILAAGLSGGQIKASSVDAPTHETFELYGSNVLGSLGTKIGPAGGYDSSYNNIFVNIPDFGSYEYVSIVAGVGDVIPWALAANMPAVPEIGGSAAAFALLAFLGVVIASRAIRSRQG